MESTDLRTTSTFGFRETKTHASATGFVIDARTNTAMAQLCPFCIGSREPGWVCAAHWKSLGHDDCSCDDRVPCACYPESPGFFQDQLLEAFFWVGTGPTGDWEFDRWAFIVHFRLELEKLRPALPLHLLGPGVALAEKWAHRDDARVLARAYHARVLQSLQP